jgi:hypothetical protein
MASDNTPPDLTHSIACGDAKRIKLSDTRFIGILPECASLYLSEQEEYPRTLERSHSIMWGDGSDRDDEQAMFDLINELREDPTFKQQVMQFSVRGDDDLHGLRHFVIHTCNGQIYIVSSMTYQVYSMPLFGTTLREVCDFVLKTPVEMFAFEGVTEYNLTDLTDENGEVYANLDILFDNIQHLQAILTIVY